MAAAEHQHRVHALVEGYLRQSGDLDAYLQQVEPALRDEVAAQCSEATFAAQFFRELPPLRLLPPLPTRVADCELGEPLGEGAMGLVFRARQGALHRDVAVKLIRAEHADRADFLARFRDEARLLASLDHPGIVHVHGCGEEQGWLFFVMDLVPGRSLQRVLPELLHGQHDPGEHDPGRPRRFDRPARLVAEVLEALAYAHRQGIVHRDIKPSNLVLDGDDHPHLVDFGLAKSAASPLRTAPGQVVGTPAYLSPELASGREHERTSPDLWAVGVVLFQMLTGRLPYDGQHTDDVLQRLLRPVPLDPRTTAPDVPRALAAICTRALAPEPTERYPSAAAFAADLRRFLAGEVVDADRRSLAMSLARLVRRHRRVLAALLLLLVLGSATVRWAAQRAEGRAAVAKIDRLAALDVDQESAAVMASALVVADELLRGDRLDDEARRRGEQLVARIRAHAKAHHDHGSEQVITGAGTPIGTPFAEHQPPVPALQAQGLRQLVEATILNPELRAPLAVLDDVQPQLQIAAPAGATSAAVRIDALDPVTGQPLLVVATATAPCTVPVPHGHYRIVVGDANAFAECTRTVIAPGTYVVTPQLVATGEPTHGMLLIAAGSAVIGQTDRGAVVYRQTTVQHPAFYIDRCEVTCADYHEFCVRTATKLPRSWNGAYDPRWAELPVYGVSYAQAKAYAEFRGKRLPTFTEWQITARGRAGFSFPWGDEDAERTRQNVAALPTIGHGPDVPWYDAVRAVGTTPIDASWCGAMDVLGNVDEWTDTPYVAQLDGVPFPFLAWHVRGGAGASTPRDELFLRLDGVGPGPTEHTESGFRCAKSAAP